MVVSCFLVCLDVGLVGRVKTNSFPRGHSRPSRLHLPPSLPAHRGRSCSLYSSIVLHSSYFILFTQSVQTIGSKINISRLFSCLPSHRGRSCSWNSSYATRLQSEKYRGILPGNLRLETVSHPFVTIYALSIIEIATKLEVRTPVAGNLTSLFPSSLANMRDAL